MLSRAVNLSKLDDIEHVSQRVIRVLGQNPSAMTLQGTNSYLIGTGDERLLLDTSSPGSPGYLELLEKVLTNVKAKISKILLTHHHHDHLGMVADVMARKGLVLPSVEVYKLYRQESDAKSYDFKFNLLNLKEEISVDGATLKPFAAPGHCDDHASFTLVEENAVFIGDAILGEGSTTFDDLHDYMASLKLVATMNPSKLYPGHGPLIEDGTKRIRQYIAHRQAREHQIVECLLAHSGEVMTTRQVVEGVYPEIPADNVLIMYGAAENTNLHLRKLVKDGRVKCVETPEDDDRFLFKWTPCCKEAKI